MSIGVNLFTYEFTYPSKDVPEWSPLVDRWYQLDAYSYGLASVYWHHKSMLSDPQFIFLASPQASNDTDRQFIENGGTSPKFFVHTLPNIRGSILLQVLEKNIPTLCLQKDPETIQDGVLRAAEWLSNAPNSACCWVLSVIKQQRTVQNSNNFKVLLWSLSDNHQQPAYKCSQAKQKELAATGAGNDQDFLQWINGQPSKPQFYLSSSSWKLEKL